MAKKIIIEVELPDAVFLPELLTHFARQIDDPFFATPMLKRIAKDMEKAVEAQAAEYQIDEAHDFLAPLLRKATINKLNSILGLDKEEDK